VKSHCPETRTLLTGGFVPGPSAYLTTGEKAGKTVQNHLDYEIYVVNIEGIHSQVQIFVYLRGGRSIRHPLYRVAYREAG
jgi:hypothetical protein